MINKIYPREQIKQYLALDVIAIVMIFYMVFRTDSALGLLGSSLLLLAFLVFFYIGLWYRDWRLLAAVLAGLTVLTVFGIYVDPSILLFGIVFADLLGRAWSKWHIGIGIAAIAVMFTIVFLTEEIELLKLEKTVFIPMMMIEMLFPIVIYIIEKSRSLQGELDEANEKIEQYIQQEERERIARDLHDTLGQTLTMIKLKSELATKWLDKDNGQAKEELKDIMATSRMALKQVRELVADMQFVSLVSEIEHSKKLLYTAGIEFEIVEKGDPPYLSSVEETMLALSVREAITNIVKHSQAKHCIMQLQTTGDDYCISIVDDGIGLINVRNKDGVGFQSMKKRMQALMGAAMVTNHSSTRGTVVTLRLPVRHYGKGNPVS
ncbi:sensor histidine kinase [Bacillaceae bacterium SIJ1]|uniref:sensor histidine kinase n=1 Tax=Litoribacterium kuwaitense TaxID=1398745 RepID=UPI0013EB2237|nr:sensor histidine kinase [Litoribacterium kuwaitense]NGP45626.1 sensor histidine kinase [Litoribacterium kuwaitense]